MADHAADNAQEVPNTTKRWTALLVVLFIAIADAGYLLWEHVAFALTGRVSGGICDLGARFNCAGTMASDWSHLAGIALPVYVLAFLVGGVALALRAGPRRKHPGAADLLLVLLSGSVAFSLFLLGVMVFTLEALCPLCLVLDALQLAALALLWSMTPGGLLGAARRVARGLVELLVGGEGLAFALPFALTFLAGSFAYATLVRNGSEDPTTFEGDPYARVQSYPTRFDVTDEDSASSGPADAPIVIVEYSDFECPHCAAMRHTLDELKAAFPGQIAVQFRHYPLDNECNPRLDRPFHQAACEAARGAVCAQAQGQFWPMHDLLFDNQRHLDGATVRRFAEGLDLDMAAFDACLADALTETRLENDIESAVRLHREAGLDGVGTPFLTLNGLFLRGNRPLPELYSIVRAELGGSGGTASAPAAGSETPP